MAISLKHTFQSAKADGADTTLVQPSNWNAEHTITAAAGKVLGRDTSGAGAVQELPIAVDTSGNVALGGALSVDGNTTLGNASTDSVTVNAGTVSIPNSVNFSGGNVGIGTSNPKGKLQVNGGDIVTDAARGLLTNLYYEGGWKYVGNGYGAVIAPDTGGTGVLTIQQAPNNTGGAGAAATPVERMRIDSAGNVGIGTSSPANKLEVLGSVITTFAPNVYNTTLTGTSAATSGNAGAGISFRGYTTGSTTTTDLAFISGVKENTTDANYAGALVFGTRPNGSGGGNFERMRIDSAGNVGIGTSSPSYQLQLSLNSAAKPTSNVWTVASDERVKTVTGEYTKGLDAVCSLRPVTYKYNGKAGFVADGAENISIIAQEAREAFPECIGTFSAKLNETDEEETELLNWDGHALTFALVNAIKELRAQNEDLRARIAALEAV